MRILFIISQLRRGGAEQQLYYLLKYCDIDATVLVLEKNQTDNFWVEPIRDLGFDVIELERRHRYDLDRIFSIYNIIRHKQPDIIHLFSDTLSSLYGRLVGLVTSRNLIVSERQHPTKHPSWYAVIKRFWLNKHISGIVTNAFSSHDYIVQAKHITPERVFVISNGIELERFIDSDSDRDYPFPANWQGKLIIGTVGSLLSKKAPEVFVSTAKLVLSSYPDVRFVHIGKGPLLPEVQKMSKNFGIDDKIIFMGEQFNVPMLLSFFDMFVLTSRFEGMPNVVMEAMAAKLPCVVTDVGDCGRLVQNDVNGYVLPIGDVHGLANRICYLLNSETLRHSMSEESYNRVQTYDVKIMAKQYQTLYQRIFSERNQSG